MHFSKYQNISFWNINHLTLLHSNKWWESLIKGTPVHIGIGQEVSQFVASSVIVQHPEAFLTKETRVTWSELVTGGVPSRETGEGRRDQPLKKNPKLPLLMQLQKFPYLPMKTWHTEHLWVRTLCLCVRSGYSFLSRQSFLCTSLMGKERGGRWHSQRLRALNAQICLTFVRSGTAFMCGRPAYASDTEPHRQQRTHWSCERC